MTIWEQLEACVSQLDEPFRRSEIIGWFRRHHPEVNEASLAAHIQGAVANATHRGQFSGRPPLLERIDHGLYRRHGKATTRSAFNRTLAVNSTGPVPSAVEAVLVGCVKTKGPTAASAKDLYRSPLFMRRREWAERTGLPWFVVSARWGLVRPDELIAPHDVHLADTSTHYRRAWAEFVAQQLVEALVLPRGASVEMHAGQAYSESLRSALIPRGIQVVDPVAASSMGDMLSWYDRNRDASAIGEGSDNALPSTSLSPVEEALARLSDPSEAESVTQLRSRGPAALTAAGLYSWWVDDQGAGDLSAGLGVPVSAGLVYAGQAGATRWPSGRRSTSTLWARVIGMHVDGNAEFSTFRRTLNVALRHPLGLSRIDDPALSSWIEQHVKVAWWPVPDRDSLRDVEKEVLRHLDPPLNLSGMPRTQLRNKLTELRRGLYDEPSPESGD